MLSFFPEPNTRQSHGLELVEELFLGGGGMLVSNYGSPSSSSLFPLNKFGSPTSPRNRGQVRDRASTALMETCSSGQGISFAPHRAAKPASQASSYAAAGPSAVQQTCRWDERLAFLASFLRLDAGIVSLWRTGKPCGSPGAATNQPVPRLVFFSHLDGGLTILSQRSLGSA